MDDLRQPDCTVKMNTLTAEKARQISNRTLPKCDIEEFKSYFVKYPSEKSYEELKMWKLARDFEGELYPVYCSIFWGAAYGNHSTRITVHELFVLNGQKITHPEYMVQCLKNDGYVASVVRYRDDPFYIEIQISWK